MNLMAFLCGGMAILSTAFATAGATHALTRTFVSGTGSGTTCSRALPCASFQAAHDATDAGGEINCVDAGEFGIVFINRSITIDCTGTFGASILATNGNAIIVQAPDLKVRLRNLAIEGPGAQVPSLAILATGATLWIENCVITRFQDAISVGAGDSQVANLSVLDSTISNIGNRGIEADSSGSGAVRVLLDGVRIEKTNLGVVTSGVVPATGSISIQIRNSDLVGNSKGILAQTLPSFGGTTVGVTFDDSSSILNTDGIDALGPTTFVILGRSTVMSNSLGLSQIAGGHIFSYQNNYLTGNLTNGTPGTLLTLK